VRFTTFALGLAIGGILGFLIATFGASHPRTDPPAPAAPADSGTERIAELEDLLDQARTENEGLQAALAEKEKAASTPEVRPAAAPAPADPPATGALRVEVLDAEDQPVPGARIYLHLRTPSRREEKRIETDAQGVALFHALTPGPWTVTTYVSGQSCEGSPRIRAGETTKLVVKLTRGSAAIEGTVRNRNGEPVVETYVNASVILEGTSQRFSTRTDEEGRYRLENLPAGKCLVSAVVKVDGRVKSLMEWIQLAEGVTVRKDFGEGVESLFGTVREAGTGRTIAGVSVRAQSPMSRTVTTDDAGQWRLLDLMPGDYTLCVSKKGYGIEFLRIEVGDASRRLDIELRPAAKLALLVTGPDGTPYSGRLYLGFRPTVEGGGTRVGTGVTTDQDGRATYDQAVPGDYEITVSAKGVGKAEVETKLESGENTLRVQLR
jgi:protocatechuate 3,4-dioxygenase beta subunit